MITAFHPGRGHGSQRSIEEANELVSQWQASGLSKQSWCSKQGILPSALNSCLHRITGPLIAASAVSHPFVELRRRSSDAVAPRMIRLTLAGSVAAAEMTIDDLGALIERLSEARS